MPGVPRDCVVSGADAFVDGIVELSFQAHFSQENGRIFLFMTSFGKVESEQCR